MKRTLVSLALCFGLNVSYAGLESLTNRADVVISENSGQINLPLEMGKKYIQELALIGKIAREFGNSPHNVGTNNSGKTIFYTDNAITSVVESAKYTPTEKGFKEEVSISGNRSVSDFSAYLVVDCNEDNGKISYNSKMYTLLESRLARWTTAGLRLIPYVDRKIKKLFQKEQQEVIGMIDIISEKIQSNPQEFINNIKTKTEKVKFTPEEIKFIEKTLRENKFIEN